MWRAHFGAVTLFAKSLEYVAKAPRKKVI